MTEGKFKKNTKSVIIRFYAELNDFLRPSVRQKDVDYLFLGPQTAGEAIESMGVPHSEVDLILVNGHSVKLNHKLNNGDQISVYPVFESIDISPIIRTRKVPLRTTKFILDAHLGKLAKYLRMFGFDSCYENDYEDSTIIKIAQEEQRIILTRDKDLLMSKDISHGYYVRAIHIKEQLREIIEKFDLYSQAAPFTRCILCNNTIVSVRKEDIRKRLDEDTARIFKKFYYCSTCDKIYWEGSHFDRMSKYIRQLLEQRST